MSDASGTSRADTLEGLLGRLEDQVDGLLKTTAALTNELKRAKAAASKGTLRDLNKSLKGADQIATALAEGARATGADWQFDEREYMNSGRYARELMESARKMELAMIDSDGRLMTYPSVVRPVPSEAAVQIDRKKERGIRPSHVIKLLRAHRDKPIRFKPETFLEALYRAYKLLLADTNRQVGATAGLLDLYKILTLMPGQAAEYSDAEFLRDIYLLESSGNDRTKDGMRVSFPAATGTKGARRLVTVTREGDERLYYGIAFRP